MTRMLTTIAMIAATLALIALPAAAHPHQVTKGNGDVVIIANGHNHPNFIEDPESGMFESCADVDEPADSGPAGYGLETAHHGPDAGTPGKADGCYATQGPPQDGNPAID
ncbi:MAG TPA: hypothetical protein VMM13_19500 [Euzebya sp.]|nr:hypothetical protein [Euzebya sp.]